ncbi:hypothetical protein [Burkholderia vietnamiensis]|uniref:hypothetical protein n=1 Tax=Burkholderia vietnamiensis TaxID=60552 RepID=UPI001B9627D2|nr:hypothetical protein [Burkholderia vietnamiensis]MBR8007434.1 hypothetical protein [Burkholderia vietnamiensis]
MPELLFADGPLSALFIPTSSGEHHRCLKKPTFRGEEMNRKSTATIAKLAVATVACIAFATAHAQTIPPACQQILTALKVCGTAYVRLTELKDPAQTPKAKHDLESTLTTSSNQLRAAVRQVGAQAVAERCAAPEAKGKMVQSIASIVTMLGFGGGMTPECDEAYSAIR